MENEQRKREPAKAEEEEEEEVVKEREGMWSKCAGTCGLLNFTPTSLLTPKTPRQLG
jgi:hypothetical protein